MRVLGYFQLHTVHQEQELNLTPTVLLGSAAFNSTRYIRNWPVAWFIKILDKKAIVVFQLHTVHQEQHLRWDCPCQKGRVCFQLHTVHQERHTLHLVFPCQVVLSTPHGTLGTTYRGPYPTSVSLDFQLHTVHQEPFSEKRGGGRKHNCAFNSTRYIRNSLLSWHTLLMVFTFNSTRYIRNNKDS